ncbi:MAG: TonB-dependent receptor [Halioglobus sp.]|nr:TonB-dependent receptor [Halioglobus sp.]
MYKWSATVAFYAAVLAVIPLPVSAADDGRKPALEEILVTATKRTESLQDVPLSVNVVSGDMLEKALENEISRLSKFVPSFRFIDAGNDVSRSIAIRGVGTNTFSRGVEQSVGTLVDGVISDSLASSLLDFGDVERIEVLHGPQGMLFGKNASAGIVNIITRDPSWELGAGLNASWDDGDERKISGFITGPLGDQFAARLSFFGTQRDPFIENDNGQDTSDRDEWGARAKLEWRPGDDLRLLFTYYHADREPHCCGVPVIELVPGGIAESVGAPAGKQNDRIANSADSINQTQVDIYVAKVEWTPGDYELSSITSFTDGSADADVRLILPHESAGFLDPNRANSDVDLFTQEVRITSPTEKFIEWIAGLYYYDKHENASLLRNVDAFFVQGAPAPDLIGSSLINESTYKNTSIALFGTATVNLTDALRINSGLRFNYDDVRVDQVIDFDPMAFPLVTGPEAPPGTQNSERDDTGWSWRLSAEYDVASEAMVYASVGQGYKGPGGNTLPTGPRAVEPIIDPEIPTSVELGLKSLWWDNRLRLNLAVFSTEFDDFQTTQVRLNPSTMTLDFFLANAGELETQGVELDAALQATDDLSLTLVAAYVDA